MGALEVMLLKPGRRSLAGRNGVLKSEVTCAVAIELLPRPRRSLRVRAMDHLEFVRPSGIAVEVTCADLQLVGELRMQIAHTLRVQEGQEVELLTQDGERLVGFERAFGADAGRRDRGHSAGPA